MIQFLIDENISKAFKKPFESNGYSVVHVSEVELTNTPDETIVEWAAQNNYSIVTFDLDFSRIIALGNKQLPSIITFRIDGMNEIYLENTIRHNFTDLIPHILEGSLITIDDNKIRVTKLPISKK